MWLLLILIILLVIVIYNSNITINNGTTEGFYNFGSGQLCPTCSGRTYNQCLSCFNCGICVDDFGNSTCIGGDVNGPYNSEHCKRWIVGDPWNDMKNINDDYKFSYGPKQGNRRIGDEKLQIFKNLIE